MTIDDAVRIRVIRAITGMDSKTFAAHVGISPTSMTSWEKGRSSPQGASKIALAKLCQENGIGFTPSGFPFPMADCMMFQPEEKQNA